MRIAVRFALLAVLGFSGSLAGCVSTPEPGSLEDKTPFLSVAAKPEPGSKLRVTREPFNDVFRTDPAMLAEIRNALSGKTLLFWDGGHGPQIEYYAANGKSYLWYPGNTRILSGTWTVKETTNITFTGVENHYAKVCTQYGGNTYNPVTHRSGSAPDCTDVGSYKIHTEEIAPGDPFNLASGKLPFVLDGEGKVPTLDELHAQML